MKCPACGFESPDSSGWCDFCKEPFRKAEAAPTAPAAPAAPSGPAKTVPVPAAVFEKLLQVKRSAGAEEKPDARIPAEFAHLDAGEQLKPASPHVRHLAWLFLAIVVIWIAAATFWLLSHKDDIQTNMRQPVRELESEPAP